MPRQRRSAAPARSAPSRPTAAPARQVPPSGQQHRPATTAAHPSAVGNKPGVPAQQGGQAPGLFGQMASTAA